MPPPFKPPPQVVTLDMGLLVAGTKYRGEFEERLKKLMDEIKQVGWRMGCAAAPQVLQCPATGLPSRMLPPSISFPCHGLPAL